MAKKSTETGYFNIFNVDRSLTDTEPDTQSDNVEENYLSILETAENEEEHVAAQTTMFDDENLFPEKTEEVPSSPIEEVTTEDTNTPSFSVEEDKLVSLLETNPLDEECEPQQIETFENNNSEPDIFTNLITYKELKKLPDIDAFETPYLYVGKNSERIRYRLHLPSENNPKANRAKKSMISWIITVLSAIIIAVLLRTFVFVIATVDGPSMMPTLQHKERLFVTKYTYKFSDIQRGDVVICRYGTEAYPLIYVKRVIGLGGEIVSIVDGEVYVNGQVIEENYILDPPIQDMEPVYVPEGSVFVMGDNRNNSADSRKASIGPLKEELIVGKVRFRVLPLNKFGSLED